ncbi:DUF6152 family protein [Candidatus Rariloculus sp.]|uniref:DUF6152 family protein n=1 Tax=Candidatus Rariloculus sp. TaxID=3101265 RepID=UPI003D121ECC
MQRAKFPGVAAVAACALVLAVPAYTHHAFAAEFDADNCRDFTGVLTRLDWQNPHAYFYLDVEDENGNVESWSFQTYALITLKRAGTPRQLFLENIGKEIWVRGCLARTGKERYAAAGTMRVSDGILRQVGQIQN